MAFTKRCCGTNLYNMPQQPKKLSLLHKGKALTCSVARTPDNPWSASYLCATIMNGTFRRAACSESRSLIACMIGGNTRLAWEAVSHLGQLLGTVDPKEFWTFALRSAGLLSGYVRLVCRDYQARADCRQGRETCADVDRLHTCHTLVQTCRNKNSLTLVFSSLVIDTDLHLLVFESALHRRTGRFVAFFGKKRKYSHLLMFESLTPIVSDQLLRGCFAWVRERLVGAQRRNKPPTPMHVLSLFKYFDKVRPKEHVHFIWCTSWLGTVDLSNQKRKCQTGFPSNWNTNNNVWNVQVQIRNWGSFVWFQHSLRHNFPVET